MNIIRPRNIKILSDEEEMFLEENFQFEIKGDLILVRSKKVDRCVAHKKDENFKLNFKLNKSFSWLISPLAVQVWEYEAKNKGYSLVKVQNTINKLIVLYQEPSQKDILNLLKRKNEKILTIN